MSRAFTRDGQEGEGTGLLPDRPISPHRNLVTRRGLGQIEAALAAARESMAAAEHAGDRHAMAAASRELRYWAARRASAELVVPVEDADEVRFGMAVHLEMPDGRKVTWRIVGEDEANATEGRIGHAAPLARSLFGKGVGDVVATPTGSAEVIAIDAAPEL